MRVRLLKLGFVVITFFSLALAIACGGGSSPAAPVVPAPGGGGGGGNADVVVTILGQNGANSFSPNPVAVKVGQTIAWQNGDSTTHDVTADAGQFNTGAIAPGTTSAPIMMSAAGSFGYHCSIHPTMVGTVTVTQ